MTKRQNNQMQKTIEDLAAKRLGIHTLQTRNSDGLDFHIIAVWELKAVLEAAYQAGQQAAQARRARYEIVRADGRKVRVTIPENED